jgi:hypothetical protein
MLRYMRLATKLAVIAVNVSVAVSGSIASFGPDTTPDRTVGFVAPVGAAVDGRIDGRVYLNEHAYRDVVGQLESDSTMLVRVHTPIVQEANIRPVFVLGSWDMGMESGAGTVSSGCSCATSSSQSSRPRDGRIPSLNFDYAKSATWLNGGLGTLTDDAHNTFFEPGATISIQDLQQRWNIDGSNSTFQADPTHPFHRPDHSVYVSGGVEQSPTFPERRKQSVKYDFPEHPCHPDDESAKTNGAQGYSPQTRRQSIRLESVRIDPILPDHTRSIGMTWNIRIDVQAALDHCGGVRGVTSHDTWGSSPGIGSMREYSLQLQYCEIGNTEQPCRLTTLLRPSVQMEAGDSGNAGDDFLSIVQDTCASDYQVDASFYALPDVVYNPVDTSRAKIVLAYAVQYSRIVPGFTVGPRVSRVEQLDDDGLPVGSHWGQDHTQQDGDDLFAPVAGAECLGLVVTAVRPDERPAAFLAGTPLVEMRVPSQISGDRFDFCVGETSSGLVVDKQSPFAVTVTCRYVVWMSTAEAPLRADGHTFTHLCPGRDLGSSQTRFPFSIENLNLIRTSTLQAVQANAWVGLPAEVVVDDEERARLQLGREEQDGLYGLHDFSIDIRPYKCLSIPPRPLASAWEGEVCLAQPTESCVAASPTQCGRTDHIRVSIVKGAKPARVTKYVTAVGSFITHSNVLASSGSPYGEDLSTNPAGMTAAQVAYAASAVVKRVCEFRPSNGFFARQRNGVNADIQDFVCGIDEFPGAALTGGAVVPDLPAQLSDSRTTPPSTTHPVCVWIYNKDVTTLTADSGWLYAQMDRMTIDVGHHTDTGIRFRIERLPPASDGPDSPSASGLNITATVNGRVVDPINKKLMESLQWAHFLDLLVAPSREMALGARVLAQGRSAAYTYDFNATVERVPWEDRALLPPLTMGPGPDLSGVDGYCIDRTALHAMLADLFGNAVHLTDLQWWLFTNSAIYTTRPGWAFTANRRLASQHDGDDGDDGDNNDNIGDGEGTGGGGGGCGDDACDTTMAAAMIPVGDALGTTSGGTASATANIVITADGNLVRSSSDHNGTLHTASTTRDQHGFYRRHSTSECKNGCPWFTVTVIYVVMGLGFSACCLLSLCVAKRNRKKGKGYGLVAPAEH